MEKSWNNSNAMKKFMFDGLLFINFLMNRMEELKCARCAIASKNLFFHII